MGCFVASIFIVLVHGLSVSLHYGTILPNLFDGDLATSYTNYVVGPVLRFLNLQAFAKTFNIVLFGLVGWFLVLLWNFVVHNYGDWKRADKDIQINRSNAVIKHPLRESFIERSAWRLAVLAAFIALLVVTRPAIHWLFKIDGQVIAGVSAGQTAKDLILAVLTWAIFAHLVIVLLRLYLFRTRLLGEIIY